jgi:integrase
MRTVVLTPRIVEAAKPKFDAAGKPMRTEIPDAGCTGLYLILQPNGARSWAHRYQRPDGSRAKDTLTNGLSLAEARHAVTAARLRLERGEDPSPRRSLKAATALTPTTTGAGNTVAEAAALFLTNHAYRKTRPSTAWATERCFNRVIIPALGKRAVSDVRRRDVIELVEHIARDRPYLANRTLGTLSKFYNWMLGRDMVTTSPVAGVEKPHKEEARDRVLSDAELRALWLASEGDGPFGAAMQMLILCGGRRNEVSQMKWDEIDEERRIWKLPGARSKNARAHEIPLSEQAWALIQSQPRIYPDTPFVFSADGKKPVTGWDKAKVRISAKAGIASETWRLHDLRRTCATGMQKLGVKMEVIEKGLNHISGRHGGIVGVYQRHEYEAEVATAFTRWANHLTQLVARPALKVVSRR